MSLMKVIGVIAGVSVLALIGGGIYLAYKRRKARASSSSEDVPSNPEPRPSEGDPSFRP